MPINKKKLKLLIEFKKNPTLALIKFAQQIEIQVNSGIKQALNESLGALNSRLDTQIESKIDQKVKESIFKGIEKIKGEKRDSIKGNDGKKGEKGDSITGEKGDSIKGEKGDKPIAGIDYPLPKDGKKGKDGKDGKNIKGETGKDGKDGSPDTVSDIKEKILTIKNAWIPIEMIKGLGLKMGNIRRKTLHRGGIDFADSSVLGIGDGSNVAFTLPHTPYDSNSLKYLFVGGGVLFENDDWTRSAKVITFITTPPTGAKVRNPSYRKS